MSVVLSEHLPLLASAPDGIQKLRGLILELAVRGKLVSQEPNNDQSTWKRGLFSDFFSLEYGDNLPAPKRTGTGEYPVYGSNGVVGTHNECRVQAPCIVVGRKGSAGALNLCRESGCWVTDVAYYCFPPSDVDLDFAFVLFHTLGLDNLGKGIKPGLRRNEAYSLPIEIPPLAEQHRIVAKVDELMALCDRLEAEQVDAAGAHARLVETLLDTLTQSTDVADLADNWQRLAEHFDTLFTTEASINALKQTVLQLAVRGKLVPQDPNDEPANELLKRIAQEQTQLVAGGIRKKAKSLSPIDESNVPFALPSGWAWARFPEVGQFGRGKSKHRPRNDPALFNPGIYPLVQTGEVARAGTIVQEIHSKYSDVGLNQSKMWPQGTLCITIAANIADSAILGFDACFPDSVVGFVPSELIGDSYYFLWFMKTAREELLKFAPSTAQKNINLEILESVRIPLPPQAEMHCIVAKIGELMALCDRLIAGLATARQRQATLANTLIESALEAA